MKDSCLANHTAQTEKKTPDPLDSQRASPSMLLADPESAPPAKLKEGWLMCSHPPLTEQTLDSSDLIRRTITSSKEEILLKWEQPYWNGPSLCCQQQATQSNSPTHATVSYFPASKTCSHTCFCLALGMNHAQSSTRQAPKFLTGQS